MSTLRLTVILGTIIALLALVYYTALELLAVWRAVITLSCIPVTAQSEQAAYMLLVVTMAFSILIIILLVVVMGLLHLIGRLL